MYKTIKIFNIQSSLASFKHVNIIIYSNYGQCLQYILKFKTIYPVLVQTISFPLNFQEFQTESINTNSS